MLSHTKLEDKQCRADKELNAILVGVVDETLTEIFKDVGVKVIYNFFEKNQHLKCEGIAERPEVFSAGLVSLLGSAAPVIEKRVITNLHRKLRLEYVDKEEFVFSDCVNELRRKMRLMEEKAEESSERKRAKGGIEIEVASDNCVDPAAVAVNGSVHCTPLVPARSDKNAKK